jgi:hypothetical protein
MRFIVDLWLDGYDTEEEMKSACKVFIDEQLDFSGSSVQVFEEKELIEVGDKILREKDAEIARLQKLVDVCVEDLIAERDHLSAENKRLRAALERCRDHAIAYLQETDTPGRAKYRAGVVQEIEEALKREAD